MHLNDLSLEELRARWAKAWGLEPHRRIGRAMLERSLAYKMREQEGLLWGFSGAMNISSEPC